MSHENSPFCNRSGLTRRSPLSTPTPQPLPAPAPSNQEEVLPKLISTGDLQGWMKSIEQHLNEVCTISSEGKLNSDLKIRVRTLCRKVGHFTSQLAVEYQALKQKAIQNYHSFNYLQEKHDLSQRIQDLKQCIEESTKPSPEPVTFADLLRKIPTRYVQPSNISSVAIYPTNKQKSSEETKSLVQKLIRPEEMKLGQSTFRPTLLENSTTVF